MPVLMGVAVIPASLHERAGNVKSTRREYA